MKVKMINPVCNNIIEVMYVAARTCYSNKRHSELLTVDVKSLEDQKALIEKVLRSGHTSIAEHIQFTFYIEDISRACSHQLVRHRLCTFSQQSQRYCNSSNCTFIVPDNLSQEAYIKIGKVLQDIRNCYEDLIEMGVKKEDARCILPNCTSTNITMTCNLRELMHICNLRLCARAQKEIRELFVEISKCVTRYEPFLKQFLQPKCEIMGFCDEDNSCGRKKRLER